MQLETLNSTVLGKIVADKADWIAARKLRQPLAGFQADLEPSDRDFVAVITSYSIHYTKLYECLWSSSSRSSAAAALPWWRNNFV